MSTMQAPGHPRRIPARACGASSDMVPEGSVAGVSDANTHAALSAGYHVVSRRSDNSSVSPEGSAALCLRTASSHHIGMNTHALDKVSLATAAEALANRVVRGLKGSMGRDTVRRMPHLPSVEKSRTGDSSDAARSMLQRSAGPLPLSGIGMGSPSALCSAAAATMESATVEEASSLRKTWAASFTDTVALRGAVSTNVEAHTAFEDALVRELNELRRAPAAYASIVEQEATIGAPYVQENDLYFADESVAESAATELRRHLEERYSSVQNETPTTAGVPTSRALVGLASPQKGLPGSQERRRNNKNSGSASVSSAVSSGGSGSGSVRQRVSRPPSTSERHSSGPHGRVMSGQRRETILPDTPNSAAAVTGASPLDVRPATLGSSGLQELTLSQLRHQFRCQQRYRAALEVALRDMRTAQQQAEAAQQAAWAAEDEKAMKKGRRFMGSNAPHANSTFSQAVAQGSMTSEPGAHAVQHSGKKYSFPVGVNSAHTGGGAADDVLSHRRSEDMMQLHSIHEARIQHMEQELCNVRNACQRSLAAANLVLDAVRALQDAHPAPLVQRHRGLSLAARDTADDYYSDEDRVVALQELFSVCCSTLVGLSEHPGACPMAPATLEQLACRLEERRGEEPSTKTTSPAVSSTGRGHTDGDEGKARDHTGMAAVPSWVLPLLSEEVSLLANVAQNACVTYGYISGEVRGLHLQVKAGSPRSLMLQMIIGSLTPVLNLSSSSLPSGSGQASQRVAKATSADTINATECCAGVRIEGRVYEAAGAPTGPSDDPSQLQVSPAPPGKSEGENAVQAPAVWLKGDGEGEMFTAAGHRGTSDRNVAMADTSHAQRVAAVAAQRLWPLLWAGAYTIGCGWQQVRGRRRVPTYAEACEEQRLRQNDSTLVPSGEGALSITARQPPAVFCTTLLFASGFEEYEVVRGCSNMSPAASRRVVQSTLATLQDGSAAGTSPHGSIADAVDARRAAVDVHSTLGVTLLTPTMHPIPIYACDDSCSTLCVAVRVPYTLPEYSATLSSRPAEGDDRLCSDGRRSPWIRVVAQVTRQCDLTPPHPTVTTDEVLAQRSPVDPSVWLVLVDTVAAFQRHAIVAVAASQESSSAALRPDEARAKKVSAASTAVPLALHIYAKDMNDPVGEFEHVAFIRFQQYPQLHGATGGGVATASCAAPATSVPHVLMAAEWRHLLSGLACVANSPSSANNATSVGAASQGAAQASISRRAGATAAPSASTGWPMLHEPLLGRDGVLLSPLLADFRKSERCGDVPKSPRPGRKAARSGGGSELAAAEGRVVRVAVQLPIDCNVRWWRRRLSMLRQLRTKLKGEIVAEGDEKAAEDMAQLSPVDSTHVENPLGPREERCSAPITDGEPPSEGAGASEEGAFLGPGDPPGVTAATVAASSSNLFPEQSPTIPTEVDAMANSSSAPAEAGSKPATGKEAVKNKAKGDSKASSKKSAASTAASGTRGKTQVSSPLANDSSTSTSKKKGNASTKDDAGSLPPPTLLRGRAPSLNGLPKLPESKALREYQAMKQRVAGASPLVSRGGSVQACLQPSLISLVDLRELSKWLQADLGVWNVHVKRVRPFLLGERDRLAAEVNKKKGRELLRVQHDHEDVSNELRFIESGLASLQQATVATSNALRTRERTQVLRRARLARIDAELSTLESRLPHPSKKDAQKNVEGSLSEPDLPQTTTPCVTLRFLSTAATAAGSGRNAVLLSATHQEDHAFQQGGGPLDRAALDDVVVPSNTTTAAEVLLDLKRSFVRSGMSSLSPLLPLEDNSPVDVYSVSCPIPPSFTGRAALYIDDEIAVTWLV